MGKSQRIRVLIVDDHAVVREGLRTSLGMLPDIQIVGEAASGLEALSADAKGKPDVVWRRPAACTPIAPRPK